MNMIFRLRDLWAATSMMQRPPGVRGFFRISTHQMAYLMAPLDSSHSRWSDALLISIPASIWRSGTSRWAGRTPGVRSKARFGMHAGPSIPVLEVL